MLSSIFYIYSELVGFLVVHDSAHLKVGVFSDPEATTVVYSFKDGSGLDNFVVGDELIEALICDGAAAPYTQVLKLINQVVRYCFHTSVRDVLEVCQI